MNCSSIHFPDFLVCARNNEVVCRLFSISTLISTLTLCLLLWSIGLGSRSRSILKVFLFICICAIESNIGLRSRSRSILKIADRLPARVAFHAFSPEDVPPSIGVASSTNLPRKGHSMLFSSAKRY